MNQKLKSAFLKGYFNHLGDEKLKIFSLIDTLAKDEFSSEYYFEGAMTLLCHSEKSFITSRSGKK